MQRLLAMVFVCGALTGIGARQTVSLYDMVEEPMVNETAFANPFTDTELRLSVAAPPERKKGDSFAWYGFHDGDGEGGQEGNVWKFRIMFDCPGTWTVDAGFYEPETNTENGPRQTYTYTVSATPSSADNHGHINIDRSHWRRYEFDDGTPYVPFTMLSVQLSERDLDNARKWIAEHKKLGVNCLGIRFPNGDQPESHWLYLLEDGSSVEHMNDFPGVEGFDYSRFDVGSWAHHEEIFRYTRDQGMKLYIWFGITGINPQYRGYGPRDETADQQLGPLQKLYVKYFCARLSPLSVWWHWPINVEWNERKEFRDLNVNYAKEFHKVDPWDVLITNNSQRGWLLGGKEEGWDLASVQLYPNHGNQLVHDCMAFVTETEQHGIPVFNSDGIFCFHTESKYHLYEVQEAIIGAWATFMAGGTSQMAYLGDGWDDGSWGVLWDVVSNKHKDMAKAHGAMARFFSDTRRIHINACRPHTEGVSCSGGNRAVCLADPGKAYCIWLDEGGSLSLDLSDEEGEYRVIRYNGNDLRDSVVLESISGGAGHTFEKTPTTGFGNHYLYVLTNLDAAQCGNGICEPGETFDSCPGDCGAYSAIDPRSARTAKDMRASRLRVSGTTLHLPGKWGERKRVRIHRVDGTRVGGCTTMATEVGVQRVLPHGLHGLFVITVARPGCPPESIMAATGGSAAGISMMR